MYSKFGRCAAAFIVGLVLASVGYAGQPGNNGEGHGSCGAGQKTNGCPGTGNTGGAGGSALSASHAEARAQAAAIAAQRQEQSVRNKNKVVVNTTVVTPAPKPDTVQLQTVKDPFAKEPAPATDAPTIVAPAQERNPVATAYAAPLTSSNGTCMGSTSGGVQLPGWGASMGSTWTDTSCDIRYDAEALRAAGLPLAAQARLCQKADIAKAMEAAGTACPGSAPKRAEATPTMMPNVDEKSAQAQYQDPIIRARLGLPPL